MVNTTNYSIDGTSNINGMDIAYFNASSSGENFVVAKNIVNKEIYEEHKEQCEADFKEFEQKAMECFEGMPRM